MEMPIEFVEKLDVEIACPDFTWDSGQPTSSTCALIMMLKCLSEK